MNERPNPVDEPERPEEEPPPSSDPAPEPNFPKTARAKANKTKVTPLDPDKNLDDGIEVNET